MNIRPAKPHGFTLISLLIGLGVIAITTAIGGPELWRIANEIKLKNAAREAITAMRAVRYRAINESREFGFSATPGSTLEAPGVMKIFEGDDPNDAAALIREIPMAGGIFVNSCSFGADDDTFVVFSPDGSAENTGSVVFKNANDRLITVSLDPASTARMQVSKVQQAP